MSGRGTRLLWATWIVSITLGIATASVFVAGVRRDNRAGEPTVGISLGAQSGWIETPFRVWRDADYRLFISTVTHDTSRVGTLFTGQFHVLLRGPDGTTRFEGEIPSSTIEHALPNGYGDTEIAVLPLTRSVVRRWTLAVRVARADQRFSGVRSEVKLWRQRDDPGMGGLINYVMIFPAMVFMLLALTVSVPLASRGWKTPLVLSLISALALFVLSRL